MTDLRQTWKNALAAHNLSLRGLARETGISHTYLGQIMAGSASPSPQIKDRIVAYFKDYPAEGLFDPVSTAVIPAAEVVCKSCNSSRTIKSGFFNGVQRFYCKDCGSVFMNNRSLLDSRVPVAAGVAALEQFFAGESMASIRQYLQDSQGVTVSLDGLEKLVHRFSIKAARLAGDIIPGISSEWLLEGTFLSGPKPLAILDVLDLETGFLIATDIVTEYTSKSGESVVKRALRSTGLTPAALMLGPGLAAECPGLANGDGPPYKEGQEVVLQRFQDAALARTQMLERRLSYDTMANCRLMCAGWRVYYNFLSGFKPAGGPQPGSWVDIIN